KRLEADRKRVRSEPVLSEAGMGTAPVRKPYSGELGGLNKLSIIIETCIVYLYAQVIKRKFVLLTLSYYVYYYVY
ncbi:MAG: hypothetical protein KC421_20410, partial [Anaerolineales bacterium]|nr:hypothetical protein [Anaerolineales bacterium]